MSEPLSSAALRAMCVFPTYFDSIAFGSSVAPTCALKSPPISSGVCLCASEDQSTHAERALPRIPCA